MTRRSSYVLSLAFVAACAPHGAYPCAGTPGAPGTPTTTVAAASAAPRISPARADRIERLVSDYIAAHRVPGLAAALVVDGRIAWSFARGLADVENGVPVTTDTLFRTASIGKTMTATAAMILAEHRRLDLDADVRTYCPTFPPKPWVVTSRELLSHLSGIRHYGGPRDREEQSSTTHYEGVADALAPFKDDPLLFEPGTRHAYSTYGYDVLGCAIEGAAGVPFLRFMKQAVWDPAGMASTRDDDPSAILPHRAAGYTLVGGAIVNAQKVDMSNRMPAGGYLTTIMDLARFERAVLSDALVSRETFDAMLTPATLKSGERVPYGLGWGLELEPWHEDTWAFHGGSSPGFSGFVALMPRHHFGLAFLTNLEDLPGRGELAEAIARVALGFGPAKVDR